MSSQDLTPRPTAPQEYLAHTKRPIAIVDDDRDMRESVTALLAGRGFASLEFGSGTAFLESSAAGLASCIVLDVRLGDMSGLEVLERVANTGGHCAPILFITAHGDVQTAVASMKHDNVLDFLEKPFDGNVFLELVQRGVDLDHRWRGDKAFRVDFMRKLDRLSPREREVLDMLAAGQTNKAISVELELSPKTVATHRAKLLEKFGVDNILDVACPLRRYRRGEPVQYEPTVAVGAGSKMQRAPERTPEHC